MARSAGRLEVVFFKTDCGPEPVRDWLLELDRQDRKTIGEDIKTIQFGWPLGMPLVDSLGQGLWEARVRLSKRRIARILFFMSGYTMVLVHGFIKKTRKTPRQDLDLARKRKRKYQYEG